MTDFTGRLQRRTEGGGAVMLPHLFERPSDPRLGPASPMADLGDDGGDDSLATWPAPVVPASTPPAFASPPPVVERRLERIVERTREVQPAEARPAGNREPVRTDIHTTAATSPIGAPPVVQPLAPASAPTTAPPAPAVLAPVPQDMNRTRVADPPRSPTRRIVAPARPDAPKLDPRPASLTETREVRPPAQPQPRAAIAPAIAATQPVARLEPRPRDLGPLVAAAPEPVTPRVVIGSLHIEVVRAPAPAPARRESPKREPSRAAAPAPAPAAGARRRTIFGLGQL
ncbi:hypothetical protein OV203_27505 [Nannocystis sp. ILAH1]|uniref:hypothetical protein n=1 Tax=Nannocystis sp. ILAH1 TaxID=2996789 RepID=UPI00227025C6|nr:hypothetical protein [Nannocystis sp. ILAH1]MCY0990922.1 hypothetical protein [Nannocystis sp. ILAH1]